MIILRKRIGKLRKLLKLNVQNINLANLLFLLRASILFAECVYLSNFKKRFRREMWIRTLLCALNVRVISIIMILHLF